ncbi:hypothetical protein [Glycomyces dulcitolivorans]|uniref:hypothetical protein n=1 Tax=Glycomyces dulcitolivorans TaxID=2200759 RepID=UPI000DD4855B|nr:hypothetical protein [Glycomyces dulcitolivorans]
MMTPDQLLDALRALGYDVIYDPETHPDGLTDDDVPDLLGRLTSALDFETAYRVQPRTETMSEFQAGYMAGIESREEFFRALVVRTLMTGSLPETEQLRDLPGVTEFHDALGGAAHFLMAVMGADEDD